MLRFKKETGKEVTEIKESPTDLLAFLYCCIASASKHDGVKFDMSLIDFADSVTLEDINKWTAAVNSTAEQIPEDDADAEDDEKKS